MTPEPTSAGDRAALALIHGLCAALAPSSVLVCAVDAPGAPLPDLPGDGVRVTTSDLDALTGADLSTTDLLWLRGCPSWHALRALAEVLDAGGDDPPPAIVVEGAPPDPAPRGLPLGSHAAEVAREQRIKEGIRLGLVDLAARRASGATLLSCTPGRGAWVLLPPETAQRLAGWIDERRPFLDALTAGHADRSELVARAHTLFDLLDRSQRTASAIVRSTRFRVGTRVVRTVRRVTRKEAFFPAPRQILRRQAEVDRWRTRLERAQPVREHTPAPDALRVTYLLPEVRISGGAMIALQLVNELTLHGVDARVATFRERGDAANLRMLTRPLVFASEAALANDLPFTDVLVATHWSTARAVKAAADAGRARCTAYLVMDYESWFYPESDVETRTRVEETYGLIPNRIVISGWLQELLERDGYPSHKRAPGLDLGVLYPRPGPTPERPVVAAMARPRTPRRGFDMVVATFAEVHHQVPEAEFVLFGEKIGNLSLPFPYRGAGVVTGQDRLARLYSRARVHFDGSEFQGFGRAGLEAMACGAVSVLTDVGGVHEYARHEHNALLVPPGDPEGAAAAIVRLLRDDALHAGLRAHGLTTVRDFSMQREARETLDLLRGFLA
jgi:glycosyltransferase involved in cell wall biosynthesis